MPRGKGVLAAIFYDFAAAFPSVDHSNVFEVCENVGFSGALLTIVKTPIPGRADAV